MLDIIVFNRPVDSAEDELIFDTETVYTTHGIIHVLGSERIEYHYIDYVVVAPHTFAHEYFNTPRAV